MAETDGLQEFRRMPAVFGPTGGPRNLPAHAEYLRYASESVVIVATARTDADALTMLLPPRFRLDGEARLSVGVYEVRNLGWLAGRGYNIVMLTIPVVFEGAETTLAGNFVPVVWEDLTDPIVTGREEIGFPKLYSDIHGPSRIGDGYHCSASWEGFRFFQMEVRGLQPAEVAGPPTAPLLVHRYLPRAFESGAEVDQILAHGPNLPGGHRAAPDGRLPEVTLKSGEVGNGSFSFLPARWEDMPTQYHIVNPLAALPLLEFEECIVFERLNQDDVSTTHVVG
jgi:hypothetical protein